jgi:hypothetical protein
MTTPTIMTVVVITLTVTITLVQECEGFAPTMMPRTNFNFGFPRSFKSSGSSIAPSRSSSLSLGPNESFLRWRRRNHHHWTTRQMAAMSDETAFLSNDPFVILGLENPTADKKVLKRAYKKRALKFHPDVVTDLHSSPEEKKKASDRFAKINGAYEQVMGKGNGSNGSNDETASSSGGWTPPHRRASSYTSSSSSSRSSEGASTDWRDYMPDYQKDNDADYDTGGDSFGQIFSDLFTGAAGAAVSGGIGGGIFNEFLEFLEGGAKGGGGFGGGSEDDADLRVLLQTATLEEVAEEMDDTDMVVKQLETKSRVLDDEIFAMDAEAKMASRFSEKIELEERGASLKARKDVVNGYLNRARKRLLSLQTRYKDLISYGGSAGNDDYVTSSGRSRSSWKDEATTTNTERPSSSSSSYSRGSTSRTETSGTRGAEGRTNDNNNKSDGDGDSWRNEGFGSSSGRSRGRRGSGRRRATSRSRSSASSTAGVDPDPARPSPAPSPSYSTTEASSNNNNNASRSRQPPPPTTTPSPSSSPSTSKSSAVSRSNYSFDVPPHRRTTGSPSFASRQEEDRKRMQEIKVDDEFEKLKKELGL